MPWDPTYDISILNDQTLDKAFSIRFNTLAHYQNNAAWNSKIESDQYLLSTDLICEGPIAGLVDEDGNLCKYIDLEEASNVILAKGVYLNNVSLMHQKWNKFNYVTQGFEFYNGSAENKGFSDFPSTTFNYRQPLLLNERGYGFPFQMTDLTGWGRFYDRGSYVIHANGDRLIDFVGIPEAARRNYSETRIYFHHIRPSKNHCTPFVHKIHNKFADKITVNISVDQLYSVSSGGNTQASSIDLIVEISHSASTTRILKPVMIRGISKSPALVPIVIDLELNPFLPVDYFVTVWPLTGKVSNSTGNISKQTSIHSVVETITKKGKFSYPYSAVVKTNISSNSFKQDPQRMFDLKLLKIKIPSNYDPESRTYDGMWDGTFDYFLKWTDNPAWIFYDLCTNQRYGMGAGNILGEDLNKWELYKIAKYCDELIISTSPRGAEEDVFEYREGYKNCVFVSKNEKFGLKNLQDAYNKYTPVALSEQASDFGVEERDQNFKNYSNGCIFLFNINSNSEKNHKKVIWQIEEGHLGDSFILAANSGEGSIFKFTLGNDVGPEKVILEDETGNILDSLKTLITPEANLDVSKIEDLKKLIAKGLKNTQNEVKKFILSYIWTNRSINSSLKEKYIDANIFEGLGISSMTGKCLPKVYGYRDPLEPRFTANVLIDNETEALKLLNDLSSIFRGMTYYRNDLITTTIDVEKPVSYFFNNTNVKDGSFTYSTGSIDGNYSVAKILFRDQYNKFSESVEVVEDSKLIKDYGIVTKEILGFGVTSRDQARRMGLWMLATNRFENQTVNFVTDIQGLLLKPGDVIEIEDSYQKDYDFQGRVVSVNKDEKYIVVDRKLSVSLVGAEIKFLCEKEIKNTNSIQSSDSYDENELRNIAYSKIFKIENTTNKVYLYDFINPDDLSAGFDDDSDFYKISKSTPFIIKAKKIEDLADRETDRSNDFSSQISDESNSLYKVVSISETDVNEYSIFAIKHDRTKYNNLDKNLIYSDVVDKNSSFVYSENITELNLNGMSDNYYSISSVSLTEIRSLNYDYIFNEDVNVLDINQQYYYGVLLLKFTSILDYVNQEASSSDYFKRAKTALDSGGGFICKAINKNQSISFSVPANSVADKTIFLGRYPNQPSDIGSNYISLDSYVKIYIYDGSDRIIEV